MNKFLCMMLIAVPLCLAGCSNDDDNSWENTPALMCPIDYRLELYNADGTPHEIDRKEIVYGWGKIEMQSRACEEEEFSNLPFEYHGNSLYFYLCIWSNEHTEHQDNVVFNIKIKSEMLFGDEEERYITLCADMTKCPTFINKDIEVVKYITSSNAQVYSDLSIVEDNQMSDRTELVMPIRLTLDGKAQD